MPTKVLYDKQSDARVKSLRKAGYTVKVIDMGSYYAILKRKKKKPVKKKPVKKPAKKKR